MITTGVDFCIALDIDGNVFSWGNPSSGLG